MAGDWIKVEKALMDKPEVRRLARVLNLSRYDISGRLFAVWAWADTHSFSGSDMWITEDDIDDIADLSGFADALRQVGWLKGRAASLEFPNFDRHNGQTAKRRAMESDKKRRQRDSCVESKPNASGQMSPRNRDAMGDQRREEKNIGINKVESHSTVVSSPVPSGSGSPSSSHLPKSVDEIKAVLQSEVDRCLLQLLPDDLHDCAYQYFNSMEGCGWLDTHGRIITKWQSHAKTYAAKWAKNINVYAPPAENGLESMPCLNEPLTNKNGK